MASSGERENMRTETTSDTRLEKSCKKQGTDRVPGVSYRPLLIFYKVENDF